VHLFASPRYHGGWSEKEERHIAAQRLTDSPHVRRRPSQIQYPVESDDRGRGITASTS
jgi:hypothetical protein